MSPPSFIARFLERYSCAVGPAALIGASLLIAALLAGCASSSSRPTDQISITPSTTRVETSTGTMEARTIAEDRAQTITIKVGPDAAWKYIAAVYGDIGLPVNGFIDQTHQISSKNARFRGRLGKLRMSQLVTCGSDITGEDRANSYEVAMDVTSAIGPSTIHDQTDLMTMVTANARPIANSGDPVRCVTTGQLEKRIATALTLKAVGGP